MPFSRLLQKSKVLVLFLPHLDSSVISHVKKTLYTICIKVERTVVVWLQDRSVMCLHAVCLTKHFEVQIDHVS